MHRCQVHVSDVLIVFLQQRDTTHTVHACLQAKWCRRLMCMLCDRK